MDSIKAEKIKIREQIDEVKKRLSFQEKLKRSKLIFKKVEEDAFFQNARIIMAYWSMVDEVHTHRFIKKWYKTKTFVLPSIDGDELRLKVFEGTNSLIKGQKFNIQEPKGEDFVNPEKIDLVIVPGIAFDKFNNRLGRGKAYYDKLLKNLTAKKIGVCFSFQFLENIPVNQYDVKMDQVFTD
jgi:5-formyltetrahydrofolate cyclo-ligase